MAKLFFKYGVMGASKTAEALMTQYRYKTAGKKVLLAKPSIDTRDGERVIKSRIGLESSCFLVSEIEELIKEKPFDVIIIDECQFLTAKEVDFLARIVDDRDIPVICYGLRSDFRTQLFEGSKRLFEIADEISEIKTICLECGKRAIINARVEDGKIITEGETVSLGGDAEYISLCRKHYKLMKLQ